MSGISELEVTSAAAVLELLEFGNANRQTSATAANETSSRSHAVLQIGVETTDSTTDAVKHGKVRRVGIERGGVVPWWFRLVK